MSAQRPDRDGRSLGGKVSAAVATLGAAIGIVVDLSAQQTRSLIESDLLRQVIRAVLLALVLLAACFATWLTAERMQQRRRARQLVAAKAIQIHADHFEDELPNDQAVIGRQLRYLERPTRSPRLNVFLHGLGLDATDFRRFAQISQEHTVALTLFGFNLDEARNDRYQPIGLKTHADLVSGAINHIQRQYPAKELVLVGFSLGADMLLRLAELWHEHPDRKPKITAALLLDPNVNRSTMSISTAVAEMSTDDPMSELKKLVQSTSSLAELQNICEYLHKITSKDLDQIRRHAQDFVEYWKDDDRYDLFLRRTLDLAHMAELLRVTFSFHYSNHFNELINAARAKGIRASVFEALSVDHFDLISDEVLTNELTALSQPSRRRIGQRRS